MKVKLIGIVVLAVLTVSLIGTTLEALDQIAQEEAARPQSSQGQVASLTGQSGKGPGDSAVVATFKYVCPFH